MLRDITLGQYYPADSILHRLDPRVKFVGTIVYVVSLYQLKKQVSSHVTKECMFHIFLCFII